MRPAAAAATEAGRATGTSGVAGTSFSTLTMGDYRTFYVVASISQALGNGAIAGMMESGNPRSGLVHAFLMLGISYLMFAVFLT